MLQLRLKQIEIPSSIHFEFDTIIKGAFIMAQVFPKQIYRIDASPVSVKKTDSIFLIENNYNNKIWTNLEDSLPCIIVNIGSGTSINLVDKQKQHRLLNGTPIGGAAILGYGRSQSHCEDYRRVNDALMQHHNNQKQNKDLWEYFQFVVSTHASLTLVSAMSEKCKNVLFMGNGLKYFNFDKWLCFHMSKLME